MTAIGAFLTFLFCMAVATLPRRWVATAYLAAVLYITQGQAVDIFGFNFMAIRFVELTAFLRVLFRHELPAGKLLKMDRWLIAALVSYVVVFTLRTGEINKYQIGLMVDGLLVYFVFRGLFADWDDFRFFMKGAVVLLVPFAFLMEYESHVGRNLFAAMGGVPETPVFRTGHYRCQASFRHAITAGTVGATFLPLCVGFLSHKSSRAWALLGVVACGTIVFASHSSGPLMAAMIAIAGWGCWRFRRKMYWVRRGIVATIIALHLAMSRPVWFIFDRISGILGGDGWHRSILIDRFLRNFGEWWFFGMPMSNTAEWAATVTKFGYVDMTNYYVSLGVNGGLISLVFFVGMLVYCLKQVGRGLRVVRDAGPEMAIHEPILWGVGVVIVTHALNLLSVSYWDQSYVIWYLHLAAAASLGRYAEQGYELPVAEENPTPVQPFAFGEIR